MAKAHIVALLLLGAIGLAAFQNCAPAFEVAGGESVTEVLPPPLILSKEIPSLDRQIFIADAYACQIKDGEVFCAGNNDYQQLGAGSLASTLTPVKVEGVSGAREILPGFRDCGGCALLEDRTVKCWGAYGYSNTTTSMQNRLNAESDVESLAIEWLSSSYYVLRGDGTVYSMNNSAATAITNAKQLMGGGDLTCALLDDGSVKCLGGQAGLGFPRTTDVIPGFEANVTMIGVGWSNLCGLFGDGKVKCVGYNRDGALGNASTANSSTAVDVQGLTGKPIGLVMSDTGACVLTESKEVECWGFPLTAKFGLGAPDTTTAFKVQGVSNAVKLYAARSDAGFCALIADGSRKCWSSFVLPLSTTFGDSPGTSSIVDF